MRRLTTGNRELDDILHGGLPSGGLVVLTGPPGSGKTVLAHQIAFANADEGPAFYYSTLSESHTKLRTHLAGFGFYDDEAIGDRVHLLQLSELAHDGRDRDQGLTPVVEEITSRAFSEQASVVIVDSSKALQLYTDPSDLRATVFELASKVSHSGAVLILVGEYGETDVDTAPEFAVADVILELANDPGPAQDVRTVRVAKLRGSSFVAGQHPFTITADGLAVDIRLEATVDGTPTPSLTGRASLGHTQLDAMTSGGVPRGDITLAMGPSGVGKTTLALHFAAAGVSEDEHVLYVALEEELAALMEKADGFGLEFSRALDDGRLRVIVAGMTDLDRLGHELRTAIREHRPRRIVVDALSSLLPRITSADRSPGYQAALARTLRAAGATSMVTSEVHALGHSVPNLESLSDLPNNVLLLRYMERGSELGRVLSVLKMRRSAHDKGLLQYEIGPSGIHILGEAGNVRQITGWTVLTGGP